MENTANNNQPKVTALFAELAETIREGYSKVASVTEKSYDDARKSLHGFAIMMVLALSDWVRRAHEYANDRPKPAEATVVQLIEVAVLKAPLMYALDTVTAIWQRFWALQKLGTSLVISGFQLMIKGIARCLGKERGEKFLTKYSYPVAQIS